MSNTGFAEPSAGSGAKACHEKKIGKTTYRVSSVYLGETDLKETLERLAVRKVLDEINTGAKASFSAN